jgi:hypothetical protein
LESTATKAEGGVFSRLGQFANAKKPGGLHPGARAKFFITRVPSAHPPMPLECLLLGSPVGKDSSASNSPVLPLCLYKNVLVMATISPSIDSIEPPPVQRSEIFWFTRYVRQSSFSEPGSTFATNIAVDGGTALASAPP